MIKLILIALFWMTPAFADGLYTNAFTADTGFFFFNTPLSKINSLGMHRFGLRHWFDSKIAINANYEYIFAGTTVGALVQGINFTGSYCYSGGCTTQVIESADLKAVYHPMFSNLVSIGIAQKRVLLSKQSLDYSGLNINHETSYHYDSNWQLTATIDYQKLTQEAGNLNLASVLFGIRFSMP